LIKEIEVFTIKELTINMNKALELWNKQATEKAVAIRDMIDEISKKMSIPPSEIEERLIAENIIKDNWYKKKK
jgi:hypothetical protein